MVSVGWAQQPGRGHLPPTGSTGGLAWGPCPWRVRPQDSGPHPLNPAAQYPEPPLPQPSVCPVHLPSHAGPWQLWPRPFQLPPTPRTDPQETPRLPEHGGSVTAASPFPLTQRGQATGLRPHSPAAWQGGPGLTLPAEPSSPGRSDSSPAGGALPLPLLPSSSLSVHLHARLLAP